MYQVLPLSNLEDAKDIKEILLWMPRVFYLLQIKTRQSGLFEKMNKLHFLVSTSVVEIISMLSQTPRPLSTPKPKAFTKLLQPVQNIYESPVGEQPNVNII